MLFQVFLPFAELFACILNIVHGFSENPCRGLEIVTAPINQVFFSLTGIFYKTTFYKFKAQSLKPNIKLKAEGLKPIG
jgi:hypothetical protein